MREPGGSQLHHHSDLNVKLTLLPVFLVFLTIQGLSQDFINPAKVPYLPHSPGVVVVSSENQLDLAFLFDKGLQVVVPDKSFKVIQFEVGYDCHSRSMFDFDSKLYKGDRVPGNDPFLRKRVIAGDLMIISNTIIEKNSRRYRLKEFAFVVVK